MAPQLQINQGPQDALLYDNSRSYFTNVGYVRTSNFQMELRDVDSQNAANLGSTVNFVIPKAADLLGPCDLMLEFNKVTNAPTNETAWGWVEAVGYAMIEKITFSVGSHDVEVLTGEHLNIINELMRTDSARYGFHQTLKTGRPLVSQNVSGTANNFVVKDSINTDTAADTYDRLIASTRSSTTTYKEGKKLCIPLGLFFTKHPSAYFPLAAIAGCNDVRIQVKFRTQKEIAMAWVENTVAASTGITKAPLATPNVDTMTFEHGSAIKSGTCKLRCHYVHVTGPEASALMNKEHVRLMKLWNGNEVQKSFTSSVTANGSTPISIDLSFLHPVQEIVITIRKVNDMQEQDGRSLFAYHGSGTDPNFESDYNSIVQSTVPAAQTTVVPEPTIKTTGFKLTLNGQSRHLDGQGIDRDYLMNRLMPMIHSNTNDEFSQVVDSSTRLSAHGDLAALAQLKDRKEIYVYPFALNPEGANPSGAVNFSKVSHAKLDIFYECVGAAGAEYVVDVYGVYYNWLAIKDGRALTSFA